MGTFRHKNDLLDQTITTLREEVKRARTKFPSAEKLLAALVEEVGEVAQALIEHGNSERSREEALQVACVALRLVEEGDADFEGWPRWPDAQPTVSKNVIQRTFEYATSLAWMKAVKPHIGSTLLDLLPGLATIVRDYRDEVRNVLFEKLGMGHKLDRLIAVEVEGYRMTSVMRSDGHDAVDGGERAMSPCPTCGSWSICPMSHGRSYCGYCGKPAEDRRQEPDSVHQDDDPDGDTDPDSDAQGESEGA